MGFVFILCLLGSLYLLKKHFPWRATLIMFIFYVLIWATVYSYDIRNLALAMPFIAVGGAYFCFQFLEKLGAGFAQVSRLKIKPIAVLLALLIAGLLVSLFGPFSTNNLVQFQNEQQGLLGNSTLNWSLLNYQIQNGFKGKILTSWDYLDHIPSMQQYYQPYREDSIEGNPYESTWMMNPNKLPGILNAEPAHYILVVNYGGLVSQAYLQYLNRLQQEQKIKAIIELPQYTLYEILVKPSAL
jgi:hypothetical protein